MDNDLRNLFRKFENVRPPEKLYFSIVERVQAEQLARAKRRFVFFLITAIASLVALVPALQALISDYYRSGFYQYLSVIFSDSNLALTYWKDFLLLLTDAFPVTATGILLASIFVFVGSIRELVLKIRPLFLSAKLA